MAVAHTSRMRIEKHTGPHRTAHLEGFDDPIHFGIIMVLNIEVAFLTPPFGVNLFVSSGITGIVQLISSQDSEHKVYDTPATTNTAIQLTCSAIIPYITGASIENTLATPLL